jgi:predicted Zn-dependent protease
MKHIRHLALAALLGVACGAAQAALPNIDFSRGFGAIKELGSSAQDVPEADEIALGRELAGRTMGAAPLVNDGNLQRYVNRIGKLIAAQSTRPDLPWRFGIIDTSSVNAFAAPGGVILVTRGLYEILDNEAQLAAVLGHEVGHVMKRHHVEVVQSQRRTRGLTGLGQTALAASGRDRLGIFDQVLGKGAELLTYKLDRNAEYDADEVGVMLAAKAGYSVSGMIDVLQKLRARAGDPSMALLSDTHPHPNDRLQAVGKVLETQYAKIPAGEEPPGPLEVAARSLPAPVAGARQAAPSTARALSNDPEPTAVNTTPGRAGGTAGGIDPGSIMRGIFGR